MANDYRNYLMHHGILGQKWGVRRYQNADGSLTAKGQKRYSKEQRKEIKNKRRAEAKNRRSLSDAELSSKIDRLQKEKRFKELSNQDTNPGREEAKKIVKKAAIKVVSTVATGAAAYAGFSFVNKFLNSKAAAYMFPNPHKK